MKIDLSYVPNNIQYIILEIIQKLVLSEKHFAHKVVTLKNETNVEKIRDILEEELRLKDLDDYVISENTHDQSEIAILRKGDIEQLGIFVCMHCSMVFESETQRTVHQRIHYF